MIKMNEEVDFSGIVFSFVFALPIWSIFVVFMEYERWGVDIVWGLLVWALIVMVIFGFLLMAFYVVHDYEESSRSD